MKQLLWAALVSLCSVLPVSEQQTQSLISRQLNEQMEQDMARLSRLNQTEDKLDWAAAQAKRRNDSQHLNLLENTRFELQQEKKEILESLEQAALKQMEIYAKRKAVEMEEKTGSFETEALIPEGIDLSDLKEAHPNTGSVQDGLLGQGFACPIDPEADFASSSRQLKLPAAGYRSAGTWAYPAGGLHLGLDLASSLYTPVKAPADGIIVYADNPVSSNGGYLGNYEGWPFGGGNTIAMICQVENNLYAVTFAHLSNRFYVKAGQRVKQDTVLALSGNSGNSTGPHTHIEVFQLKVTLQEAVRYFQKNADFSFGCGWNAAGTCSPYGCRIRPETVFES